jgi:hypothetical protein
LKTVAAVKWGYLVELECVTRPRNGKSIVLRDVTFERSQHEIVQTSNELKAILNASEFSIIAVVTFTEKNLIEELKFYWDMKQKNWSGKGQ